MKYLVAKFKIATSEDLLQVCKDLLADSAAEAGFESFEETQEGLEAYVQKELFDKDALDASIADFPIEGTDISYTIEDAEATQPLFESSFHPHFQDLHDERYAIISITPLSIERLL